MERDDFWIARFKDNRALSVLDQLRELIQDCDDPAELRKIETSLKLGLANYASSRRRILENK